MYSYFLYQFVVQVLHFSETCSRILFLKRVFCRPPNFVKKIGSWSVLIYAYTTSGHDNLRWWNLMTRYILGLLFTRWFDEIAGRVRVTAGLSLSKKDFKTWLTVFSLTPTLLKDSIFYRCFKNQRTLTCCEGFRVCLFSNFSYECVMTRIFAASLRFLFVFWNKE